MAPWFYLFIGLAIIGLTATRPRWFWQHPKALFLRSTIGDIPTAVFYYLNGAMAIAFGLFKLSLS